jgi:hypothetical protein
MTKRIPQLSGVRDYETWKYVAPIQKAAWSRKTFGYGTWGGEIRAGFEPQAGDVVVAEHWCSSGFANTDLDLQLKKHGIQKLIVTGLIAHTCVEATVRYGAELGYEVTMVKDATASYSDKEMHAALEVNIPNYASAIVTTDEIVDAICSLGGVESPPGSNLRRQNAINGQSFWSPSEMLFYALDCYSVYSVKPTLLLQARFPDVVLEAQLLRVF